MGVVIPMTALFAPLTLRGTTFRNRAWVSPMCQYSSVDGRLDDWHLVHLGSLARGGAGLVVSEATAVTPEGRISPADAGIWNDEQAADWARMTAFISSQGARSGIQLGHAGRKASTQRPWDGRSYVPPADGGWQSVGASPSGYADLPAPRELLVDELGKLVQAFATAATRADAAGFDVVELHGAHGYLLHQFLSPLTNTRTDAYGGDLAGRARLLYEVTDAVRAVWPEAKPLFVRLSATDWADGGWTLEETVEVSRELKLRGVDLIDVTSGGNVPQQKISVGPGYQVPFARAVREQAQVPVAAVGMLTEPAQVEQVLAEGSADAAFLARALLRDPHWPLRAAYELGVELDYWPKQYERAAWT